MQHESLMLYYLLSKILSIKVQGVSFQFNSIQFNLFPLDVVT